jgi:hypothetical protein
MQMTKAKRKAPSRVKYEQAHPTVSCRVSREVYDRLRAATEAKGMSFADALKVGLGLIEVQVATESKVRWQGHDVGYKKGYSEAEQLYKVTYPCNVCKKTLTVTSVGEKEDIKKYMQEQGWGHGECHKGRQ